MPTLANFDEITAAYISIFDEIERELLAEIASRLISYDGITGSLVWMVDKLAELHVLDADMIAILSKYSGLEKSRIRRMLEQSAFTVFDKSMLDKAYEKGLITDPEHVMQSDAMNRILTEAQHDLEQGIETIKTNAVEYANEEYRKILTKVYTETASGVKSGEKAIQDAVLDMAKHGVTAAHYVRPNGKVVRYGIESCVRRDTTTAVHQLQGKACVTICKEVGAEYVEVSSHIGARIHPTNPIANHFGWQGKVYKIDGSDEKYPNLKEKTGYPDDILGLKGVNCRHEMFPFIPDVSVPSQLTYDEKENERVYKLSQEQRKREREIRRLKKEVAAAEATNDPRLKELKQELREKQTEMESWTRANGLRRNYNREAVIEEQKLNNAVIAEKTNPVKEMSDTESLDRLMGDEQARGTQRGFGAEHADTNYLRSPEYKAKFNEVSDNPDVNEAVYNSAKTIIDENNHTTYESLHLINAETGKVELVINTNKVEYGIKRTPEEEAKETELRDSGIPLIAIHNHPNGMPPDADDAVSALERNYEYGIVVGHNGSVYRYDKSTEIYSRNDLDDINSLVEMESKGITKPKDIDRKWSEVLNIFGISFKELS